MHMVLFNHKIHFHRTGYNIEDIRGKFNKVIEKNADSGVDAINNRLADLVSIVFII